VRFGRYGFNATNRFVVKGKGKHERVDFDAASRSSDTEKGEGRRAGADSGCGEPSDGSGVDFRREFLLSRHFPEKTGVYHEDTLDSLTGAQRISVLSTRNKGEREAARGPTFDSDRATICPEPGERNIAGARLPST